jgi:polysaccharide export outer membrane protein
MGSGQRAGGGAGVGLGLVAILLALALTVGPGVLAATAEASPPGGGGPAASSAVRPVAEAAPPAAGSTASAPASSVSFAEYRVCLGDRLQLSIWGEPDLTCEPTVMPDGTASWPLVGTRVVAGKTVAELAAELGEAYRRYLRDPKISLSCIPRTPPQVYFEGAVGKPGPIEYDPRSRLLDYLALAGGPAQGADLTRVVVTSVSGTDVKRAVLDVSVTATGPALENNPWLKPGDTVWVGRALPVSVVGAVNRPGAFEYRSGLRLSDYLALAGGPTDRANLRQAMLKHTGSGTEVRRVVDLSAALRAPDGEQTNPILAPGDTVSVPEAFVAGGLQWSDILHALATALIFWR